MFFLFEHTEKLSEKGYVRKINRLFSLGRLYFHTIFYTSEIFFHELFQIDFDIFLSR